MESQAVEKRMPHKNRLKNQVSLYISKSNTSSRINKTGSWRFARPVYENKTAPCSAACPAANHIPKIEMHVSRGEFSQAFNALMMENPFPSTCGRVCFHTCEPACNRSTQDQPLSIRCLERFIGDMAISENLTSDIKSLPQNNKNIAILGAGPAGLSAAYFLSLLGFSCEIFEATDRPGGVMQWGIPSYRLPKSILNYEIDRILKLGARIHYNQCLDADFIESAHKSHDAVFVSPGLSLPLTMGIKGEEHVKKGLALLMAVQLNGVIPAEGRVAVIGGGNTAIDVARTLKRLGADPVIIYRRQKEDMPAFEQEIRDTEKEGIEILELKSPVYVEQKKEGFLLTLQPMEIAGKGTDGRTRVVPSEEETLTMMFNGIYSGIGATLHDAWHPGDNGRQMRLNTVAVDFEEIPVLYGGDCVNKIQSVTHAIASGKEAAIALYAYFDTGPDEIKNAVDACRVGNGDALSMEIYLLGERSGLSNHIVTDSEINRDYFKRASRIEPEHDAVQIAVTSFDEVEKTFSRHQAMEEALRCYQCGFCNECNNCKIFCPEISITRQHEKKIIDMDYCKGCGVCSVECPRNAITMEEEE